VPDTTPFELTLRDTVLRGSVHHGGLAAETPRLLALHGGGQSSRQGFRPLLTALAAHGHTSAAFDFAGHGESGGQLIGSSLAHRAEQALAVASHLGLQPPVALLGSSMGGHVACTLIDALAPRALVLFCPAAYAPAAQHLPFGPAFQSTLRATASFDASPAFEALERFTGRLLLVFGTQEDVIPEAVQQQYLHRARQAQSVELIRLQGAGHRLHDWLAQRPDRFAEVLGRVRLILEG